MREALQALKASTQTSIRESEAKEKQSVSAAPAAAAPAPKRVAGSTKVLDEYLFEQTPTSLTVFLRIDGVGSVPRENIHVAFGERAVVADVRLNDGSRVVFSRGQLHGRIVPAESSFRQSGNRLKLVLKKAPGESSWPGLDSSSSSSSMPKMKTDDSDPMDSIMGILRK